MEYIFDLADPVPGNKCGQCGQDEGACELGHVVLTLHKKFKLNLVAYGPGQAVTVPASAADFFTKGT